MNNIYIGSMFIGRKKGNIYHVVIKTIITGIDNCTSICYDVYGGKPEEPFKFKRNYNLLEPDFVQYLNGLNKGGVTFTHVPKFIQKLREQHEEA